MKVVCTILVLALLATGSYLYYTHHNKPTAIKVSLKSTITKTVTKSTATTSSYYVGDSQIDGGLNIKFDSSSVAAPSMGTMPANTENFEVELTITNNGTQMFVTPDAFGSVSKIYTQIGSDTSTGKYVPSENTQGDSNACFGGGEVDLAPGQTISGCVLFLIPTNVSVDTYFYNNLKWYL